MSKEKWRKVPGTRLIISNKGRLVSVTYRGLRLPEISGTGRAHLPGSPSVRAIYREVWGQELEGKPYPVQGRWLERYKRRKKTVEYWPSIPR